jgi:regulator of RNase E activity RraB
MNYQEFVERVQHSMHETIYEDSEGRSILIIDLLDAFGLANKLIEAKREWVNLTTEEIGEIYRVGWANNMELARAIEAKLKEKNERPV